MGLATYIMTAALYLLMVVAALSQSVVVAFTLGAAFGLSEAWLSCSGVPLPTPRSLRSFHRRFSAVGPQIRLLTIAVEGGCAVACVLSWVHHTPRPCHRFFHHRLVYLTNPGGRLRRPSPRRNHRLPQYRRRRTPTY